MKIEELERRLEEEREVIRAFCREAEKQTDKIDKHAAEVARLQVMIAEVKNDPNK